MKTMTKIATTALALSLVGLLGCSKQKDESRIDMDRPSYADYAIRFVENGKTNLVQILPDNLRVFPQSARYQWMPSPWKTYEQTVLNTDSYWRLGVLHNGKVTEITSDNVDCATDGLGYTETCKAIKIK